MQFAHLRIRRPLNDFSNFELRLTRLALHYLVGYAGTLALASMSASIVCLN